jgi:hypothetical protein
MRIRKKPNEIKVSHFGFRNTLYEELVTKTSPTTNHSVNALYIDLEMVNVLVNDPEQDCGNEQNTQFETTCAVLGTNVIVGYVDSNPGVYGLGTDERLTNYTPRLVGYATSRDGGATFEDRGVPPLSTRDPATIADDGDAGDPVLAVDTASQIVYLVGTSSRNLGSNGIPLWKSVDGGASFTNPLVVGPEILQTDKPWIAVDDAAGLGQHDVYVSYTGVTNAGGGRALWMVVSTNGADGFPTNSAFLIRWPLTTNFTAVNSPIVQVGPDHVAYVFWFERTGDGTNWTNSIMMRQVQDRGTATGDVHLVRQLVTTWFVNGNLQLRRSNSVTNGEFFNAWPFPVPAVNPATNRAGHLYVTYADIGENTNDSADIFFVYSTDGGITWSNRTRVNSVWTNDQWMPVMTVKPDGIHLFVGWYDRRNDTNNSLIEVYGRWGTIGSNGTVTFESEFRISTVSFLPVFAGTQGEFEPIYKQPGYYDPVYPPRGINLHWWYPDWPPLPPPPEFDENLTLPTYEPHVGEYNGIRATESLVYMTWTDYRGCSPGTLYGRLQSDIRLIKLSWP